MLSRCRPAAGSVTADGEQDTGFVSRVLPSPSLLPSERTLRCPAGPPAAAPPPAHRPACPALRRPLPATFTIGPGGLPAAGRRQLSPVCPRRPAAADRACPRCPEGPPAMAPPLRVGQPFQCLSGRLLGSGITLAEHCPATPPFVRRPASPGPPQPSAAHPHRCPEGLPAGAGSPAASPSLPRARAAFRRTLTASTRRAAAMVEPPGISDLSQPAHGRQPHVLAAVPQLPRQLPYPEPGQHPDGPFVAAARSSITSARLQVGQRIDVFGNQSVATLRQEGEQELRSLPERYRCSNRTTAGLTPAWSNIRMISKS